MRFFPILLLFSVSVSADNGWIMQITDTHLDLGYIPGSPAHCLLGGTGLGCCHSHNIPIPPYRSASPWGDFNCDSPIKLLNLSIAMSKEIHGSYVDYILWTGDSPSHHDFAQSITQNLEAIYDNTALLKYYFPDVQVIPAIGNHDTWPIDQMAAPPKNAYILNNISNMWRGKNWIPANQQKLFNYGGYYRLDLTNNVSALVLNTLYYDRDNLEIIGQTNIANQNTWLQNELHSALENNRKVWLIGHIFPGAPEALDSYTLWMKNIVCNYSNVIVNQFWGHTHTDQFKIYNCSNNIKSHLYIAPSIVPDKHNPSVRFYQYNRNTFELINYEQYWLNLTRVIKKKQPEPFQLLYSAKNTYQLDNLNSTSWFKLANKIYNNATIRNRYCYLFNVGNNSSCSQFKPSIWL